MCHWYTAVPKITLIPAIQRPACTCSLSADFSAGDTAHCLFSLTSTVQAASTWQRQQHHRLSQFSANVRNSGSLPSRAPNLFSALSLSIPQSISTTLIPYSSVRCPLEQKWEFYLHQKHLPTQTKLLDIRKLSFLIFFFNQEYSIISFHYHSAILYTL